MIKALDKRIEIQDVYLLEKTGGKSGDFHRMIMIDAAVLTISDSVSAGTRATVPVRRCVNGWNNWAGASR